MPASAIPKASQEERAGYQSEDKAQESVPVIPSEPCVCETPSIEAEDDGYNREDNECHSHGYDGVDL